MHVVVVDGDVTYPPTSGKRLRTLNLMLPLARRHRITYVGRCDTSTSEAQQAEEFLRDHGIHPILIHDPVAKKSGLGFYGRLFGNLFSSLPYSVASHDSPPMRAALLQLGQREKVDLWQVEWPAYLRVLDSSLKGPRLAIAHNVDTLIWQRYAEHTRGWLKRRYIRGQWRKFQRFETWAFQAASRVVAVSAEDAALIRTQFGQNRVDVVDNGIDRAYFDQAHGIREPNKVLFLGALDWRPNQDAVALLLDRIFPAVRAQVPEARLVVVGRKPTAGLVQRIATMENVEMHADVPDVRPFLAGCGVMVVPLRIGGGSRLKILEALACGLPVVSTRVGAEGLALEPGRHYVAAEEDAMAQALVAVLHDPGPILAMAEGGRELVRETYDWPVLADKLEQVWERCVREAAS